MGVNAAMGLYPRLDDGALAPLVGVCAAVLGSLGMHASLGATNAGGAAVRALLLSILLGTMTAIIPGLVLAEGRVESLPLIVMFAGILGAPTGFVYGAPLAILARLAQPLTQDTSQDAADRLKWISAIWLGLVSAMGACLLGLVGEGISTAGLVALGSVPFAVGVGAVARLRLRARAAWTERVRVGLEPAFRIRVATALDPVDALPCVAEGSSVVEWVGEAAEPYRAPAVGVALARVAD